MTDSTTTQPTPSDAPAPTERRPLPNTRCPLCGGANHCAPAQAGHFELDCWCRRAPVSAEARARVPAPWQDQACLCPRCAAGGAEE